MCVTMRRNSPFHARPTLTAKHCPLTCLVFPARTLVVAAAAAAASTAAIADTFYFIFIGSANRRWQFWGLMAILAYASGTLYLTYEALVNVNSHVVLVEAFVNACKALANMCVGFHALQIFSMLPSPGSPTLSRRAPGRAPAAAASAMV